MLSVARAYCYRCFKPEALCVCDGVVVRNRTRVVILQHPRERQHPLGTERFARLGLHDCAVQIAWGIAMNPEDVPPGAALLYPSEHAREVTSLAADERPRTLIAIDGTWSQARSLYRKNPWLETLPHVKLTQAPPSNYRIRREPRAHYVSTIEALVHALRALEPDTEGFDALLARFDAMIDRQLAFQDNPPPNSYKHSRREQRVLQPHPLFRDSVRSPVVGYAEYVGTDARKGGALIQVCVERVTDGARYEALLSTSVDAPEDEHLHNMELTREQLAGGVTRETVIADLARFVRAEDFLVAWSPSTIHLLQGLATWTDTLILKGLYGNLTRSRPGELQTIAKRHGYPVATEHYSGRAGRRMAAAVALATWMHNGARANVSAT